MRIKLFFLMFFVCLPYAFADVPTPKDDGREELINRELNAAARRIEFQQKTQESPVLNEFQESSENFDEQVTTQQESFVETFKSPAETKSSENKIDRERLKKVELALQYASYNYETDENFPYYYSFLYDVSNQVEKSGGMWGGYLSYTYRKISPYPIHNFKDLREIQGNPFFTFARLEGELSFGSVDYDSYATGKLKDKDIWQGNFRVLAGYDFLSQDETFMVTPYVGFGYRRVEDKTGGWFDDLLYDYGSYTNTYDYYYVPIGFETLKRINGDWDIGFKLEGDILVYGDAKFELSEIPGIYTVTDADTGDPVQVKISDSSNLKFRGGFGFKTSFKVIKKFVLYNVFAEPFFELWKISKTDSSVSWSTSADGKNWYSVYPDKSDYKPLYEPASYMTSFGLRLGVQF